MRNRKKKLTGTFVLAVISTLLLSCGSAEEEEEYPRHSSDPTEVYDMEYLDTEPEADYVKIPACNTQRQGTIIYLKAEWMVLECHDGHWVPLGEFCEAEDEEPFTDYEPEAESSPEPSEEPI